MRTKNIALLILTLILLQTFEAWALTGDIKVNQNAENKLILHDNTYFHFTASNFLNDIHSMQVSTPLGEFSELAIEGYSFTQQLGKPKLPVKRNLIEVPVNAKIKVNITNSEYKDYHLEDLGYHLLIIPAQPPVSKNDESSTRFRFDTLTYNKNAFYPSQLINVEILGFMRGLRLGRLDISPVQYNPVSHTLRVYTVLSFEVIFTNANVQQTKKLAQLNNTLFYMGITHELLNYKHMEVVLDTLVSFPIKYVIVSDPMFQTALQPFIQWKKKKGFTVIEAYTNNPAVGSTTTSIRNYLLSLYNSGTSTDPPPSFVLFVGDVNQVPTFSGTTGTHPTDLYYCEYTGDYLPEVYYGRFSASNESQLLPQINKTLEYEQYTMPDPSFLGECVMIAGMDPTYGPTNANGQINYGTTYYFNTSHGLNSHTYLYPNSGNQAAQIIQNVSGGCCFANYTAHGSTNGWYNPSFTISDVASLTNAHKYPLMVGNACLTNKFNEPTDCFGEALLKAADKGALAYIGGTDNTYWDEDFYWAVGFKTISANPGYSSTNLGAYDRTFHDHGEPYSQWYVTQGQMVAAGNLAVTSGSPGMAGYYWEIYQLLGDPSLMVYYSVPPALTATYANQIPMTSTTFTVTTEPYAYAAFSINGVLHGAAQANSSGLAVINLSPLTASGTADVVVTKQNRHPFTGTVSIYSPTNPVCIYHHNVINDSGGNNNGLVDYGESILLSLGIQNIGLLAGNNIMVSIGTQDPNINITDSIENYGSIAPGSIVTINNGFAFNVLNNVPDGHFIVFTVRATDGNYIWISSFQLQAHAPSMSYSGFSISDPLGNDNNKLDPGETVNFILQVNNTGSSQVNNVMGILNSSSTYVTINIASASFGNIAGGDSAQAIFSITAGMTTPPGNTATFSLNLNADLGQSATGSFSVYIGQIPALVVDLDVDHSSGPAIQSAIQNNNLTCSYLTAFPVNLNLYASVFVCLGIYSNNTVLQSIDGQTLANYLDNGGNLYMEGGDTWAFDAPTPVHPYFKITGLSDGAADLGIIQGVNGTFTQGITFVYSGENNWIDRLGPMNGSTAFAVLDNQSPAYTTSIAYNGGTYRTIGASHEFAGLTDASFPSTKSELMSRYLEFFGLLNNQVTAGFNVSDTVIIPGFNVSFTDQSTGVPLSWNWSFPGGTPSSSTLQNPVVTYLNPGYYNVSLTVTHGLHTSTLTKTNFIRVRYSMVVGTVTYANALMTHLSNVNVKLKSGALVVMQTTTNSNGYYQFTNVDPGSYTLEVTSTKAWGGVNSTDALIIMRHFVGLSPLTGIRLKAGDVDASTNVNSVDALYVQRRSVGLLNSFPAGDWTFEQASVSVDGFNTVTKNISGLCYGDVNASYTPPAKVYPAINLENEDKIVDKPAEYYLIAVRVKETLEIGAVTLSLKIPGGIKVLGVSVPQAGEDGFSFPVGSLVYNIIDDQLLISWCSVTPQRLSPGDELLTIECNIDLYKQIPGNLWTLDPISEIVNTYAQKFDMVNLIIENLIIPDATLYLGQNIPNPFSDQTEICFSLPEDGPVSLKVYDMLGREVLTLVETYLLKGEHSVKIDLKMLNLKNHGHFNQATYLYRIELQGRNKFYSDSKLMINH